MSNKKPNIILILFDDMGFSDLGCFGSEIHTPNIDYLANRGQVYTEFYNTARCCPSRASLMTGLHPHQTGVGDMSNSRGFVRFDRGIFGYRGDLNRFCTTIPEVLKQAGYSTYMTGKWHLGQRDISMYPTRRGFDKYYGVLSGACNYFSPIHTDFLMDMETEVKPWNNFYTTDVFTDKAINFIEKDKSNNPFFLYLSYNAPHWPLQAPKKNVDKYRNKYKKDWDIIRKDRYESMVKKGIINPRTCKLSPLDSEIPDWNSLTDEKKDEMDLRMATYAAQIDSLDENIGKLIDYLKKTNKFDDTLIALLSDNGACAEGGVLGRGDPNKINCVDIGEPLMLSYGKAWANVSNTPFRMYKHYVNEGGIATPLIMHWPNGIHCTGIFHEPLYLIDIMPTFLELAQAQYPYSLDGNPIPKLEGTSMVPMFTQGQMNSHEYMYWEHEENCTVRHGRWKAIKRYDKDIWQLYDIENDRSELENLSDQYPGIVDKLSSKWDIWAKSHCVIPKWYELNGNEIPDSVKNYK